MPEKRKLRGSGWFITVNTNVNEERLGGEAGIQRFKAVLMYLFGTIEGLAVIIRFMQFGPPKEENTLPVVEAIKKFVQTPIFMEGCIERVGISNNKKITKIHAHIIVGIEHYSYIQLNSQSAQAFINKSLGLKGCRFTLGGETSDGYRRVYRDFPTQTEVNIAMSYAGKYLVKDGDYFSGDSTFTVKEYTENYGSPSGNIKKLEELDEAD